MYSGNFDGRHDPVRSAARYYANCAKCGREQDKKRMINVYVKDGSYAPIRILCHICRDCMPELLDELEVAMPE